MENIEIIQRLKVIKNEYSTIHDGLSSIESRTRELESERSMLSTRLDNARSEEKDLINKLEEKLGTQLTYEKLASLIN